MSKKKSIILAVSAVAAIAVACVGLGYYRDCRRERTDKRASECLHEYYRIIGDGRTAIPAEKLEPILSEMAKLSEECSDSYKEPLFSRRLDGAFLIGDFALAEKMMDDMPGKSANWKEGAKAKIRAHAALIRGDKAAAIREFETFCQTLLREGLDSVECDPCSGIEWPCESLLARNLKRMSDLSAEIGDKDRAAKYLGEARKYAAAAMLEADEDPDLKAAMTKEFEELLK